MDGLRTWRDERALEKAENKRLAKQRRRHRQQERKREASRDSAASGSAASTDTGRSNDAEDAEGVLTEQLADHGDGSGRGRGRGRGGGVASLERSSAQDLFVREKTATDKKPHEEENNDNGLFIQGGNYNGLRKDTDMAIYQLQDLKSSPAQILLLNECPGAVVDFLELPTDSVSEECVCQNKKGEPRTFKQWMCMKPNEIEWSNAVAVQVNHFSSLKVKGWIRTSDGTYTAGNTDGPGVQRKICHSRILTCEAVTHPSRGFVHLGRTIVVCNCHLHYMTAKMYKKAKGVKAGFKVFFDTLAEELQLKGVHFLYGDWNMALLVVKSELAKRGVKVDLCAWMPVAQPHGLAWFDTCAMFLVGGCTEPPLLSWGPRAPEDGGGDDGLDWILDVEPCFQKAIPENEPISDDEADAAVAAEGSVPKKKQLKPLLRIVMKDGAVLRSFQPACAIDRETDTRRNELNRAALASMFTRPQEHYAEQQASQDNAVPTWPGVKQKLLDRDVYDQPGKLLLGGTHVPIAIATDVPSHRSVARQQGRGRESAQRYWNKRNWTERSDSCPARASPESIGARSLSRSGGPAWPPRRRSPSRSGGRDWPPSQQGQRARQAQQPHGAWPGTWQANAQWFGDRVPQPMAPYYDASRGGGRSIWANNGVGYPTAPSPASSSEVWVPNAGDNPWYPQPAVPSNPDYRSEFPTMWHHGI